MSDNLITSTLNYNFEINPLTKLDIPSNIWLPYGRCSEIFRTDKGTGYVWNSDNGGTYDKDGVYQSCWYEIEKLDGNWHSSLTANSWDMAKQKVEEILNEKG